MKNPWAKGAAAIAALYLGALAAAYALPLPARLTSPHSVVVEYRDGTPAHVFLAADDKWRAPVDLAHLDPAYVTALLRLEDKRFYRHPGVDPLAIARAAALNLTHLERVSGGSTLTMQLVRVLEPRPRTYLSKLIEALRSLQLELRLSKTELLTAYLQFVPYGRNLEGVESASLAYFGHPAANLTAAEIATLLAVPQNPAKRFPTPENQPRLARARDTIAARLLELDALKVERGGDARTALAEILATAAPRQLKPFPREAPHAALYLRAHNPSTDRIRSTLDGGAQRVLEALLRGERAVAEAKGIHNASVVVVDHATGEVRATAGSFDFFDPSHGGQIIGFDNPRSPGSALKPFLYALAIDRGLAGPQMLVPDIPVSYGAYSPHNFDGTFSGLVRLEDALSRSLNVPFVTLLDRLGVENVLGRLHQLGVHSLSAEPGYYGLSLAVGGVEVTPLELSGLFATLAEDGVYRPVHLLATTAPPPTFRAFAPGAAFLTRQALSLRERPDFPERRRINGAPKGIHWKTGTSFGHRDAWAAGSYGPVTAVVWMGNFDNSASVHLVGAEAAGPLMFDVLEALAPKAVGSSVEPRPPADLTTVEVCAYSGQLRTDACPEGRLVSALRQAVPSAHCPYHKAYDVDARTGEALSPTCREGRQYERKSFVVWPASVRRYLRDQQRLMSEPPALAEGCEPGGARHPPAIVSPVAGQTSMLLAGVPPEDQEIPLEADAPTAELLSWFVDGRFLGTAHSDERVWWTPSPGTHEVFVADTSGQSARRTLIVRARTQ